MSVPNPPPRIQPAIQPVPMLDLKRQYEPLQQELLEALRACAGDPAVYPRRAGCAPLSGPPPAHWAWRTRSAARPAPTHSGWRWPPPALAPGDAVVTTPFSFFASVSSILRAGARPVLADIDPVTFNLARRRRSRAEGPSSRRSAPFCRCISTASAPTGMRFRA